MALFFFFKAVLTSRKHQTTCCVLQLQAASSRSTSTDWLYDYPTGYITDPARRVAVGGSLTAHKSVEPPAQPPHRCLSNAVLYCWMTHVFSSFFLCAIYIFVIRLPSSFSRCPVRTGNRCHHLDPLSTRSVTRPMLHPVVHPAITPCEAPSDAPFPAPCDASRHRHFLQPGATFSDETHRSPALLRARMCREHADPGAICQYG